MVFKQLVNNNNNNDSDSDNDNYNNNSITIITIIILIILIIDITFSRSASLDSQYHSIEIPNDIFAGKIPKLISSSSIIFGINDNHGTGILIFVTNIHHHIRIDATVYKLTVIERIEMVTGWRRVAFRLKNNIGALVSPRKAQYQNL